MTKILDEIGVSDVFCSSIPQKGVYEKIPDEIKQALTTSIADIIILSHEYLKSRYCLNEAGIIWFKESRTRIIVSINDNVAELSTGFINADYLRLDINNELFVDEFIKRVKVALPQFVNTATLSMEKLKELEQRRLECVLQLPLAKNLQNNKEMTKSDNIYETARNAIRKIRESMNEYEKVFSNPTYFYQYYSRSIIVGKGEGAGNISVNTITDFTAVNLSNEEHPETFSCQFVRNKGGIDTFRVVQMQQDGIDYTKDCESLLRKDSNFDGGHKAYVNSPTITRIIPAHHVSRILYRTTYEIPLEMFFNPRSSMPLVQNMS